MGGAWNPLSLSNQSDIERKNQMGIHLKEQEFVADMESLVRDFDLWRNAAVPYPPDFVASIAERAYGVFGQTRPADIVAIAVNSGDEDLTEQAVAA